MSKIFHFITHWPLGGAQSIVASIVSSSSQHDHVILYGNCNSSINTLLADKSSEYPFISPRINPIHFICSIIAIRRFLLTLPSKSIIHIHSFWASFIVRFSLMSLPGKFFVIYSSHGFAFAPPYSHYKRFFSFVSESLLAYITDLLICPSNSELNLSSQLFLKPKKVIKIPHSLSISTIKAIEESSVRSISNLNLPVVVFPARMSYPKRQDLAVLAMVLSCTDFELHFLGSGDRLLHLEANISSLSTKYKQRVFVYPEKSGISYFSYIKSSSILLALSDWEGYGLTVLEAATLNIPVIMSNKGALPELADFCNIFRLVGTDPAEIAVAIDDILALDMSATSKIFSSNKSSNDPYAQLQGFASSYSSAYSNAFSLK